MLSLHIKQAMLKQLDLKKGLKKCSFEQNMSESESEL